MIEIKNLKKYYGDKCVLDDINISIKQGEIYGLIGESGSGKSTLLNCINRIESFEEGSIKINGIEVKDLTFNELRDIRKGIGMIFQGFSLIDRKSVYKNIALPMECWKIDKGIIERRVEELADVVGLKERLMDKPSMLSGGQKQRVAIARALTQNPTILMCDECTSALDPSNTESILKLLKELRENLGITILIVTHEMSIIQALCDRVSIIKDGKIVQTENVDKMFINKSEELKSLLGKKDVEVPTDGITISFSGVNSKENSYIVYEIGEIVKNKYSIIDSSFIDTVSGKVFSYTINIDKEDYNTILEFFDKYKLIYEIISYGGESC
ncbi:methionine ABC transporter ATP-binding protein [Peptostreptococcus faecalis]|uniref:methionine ABC transporter ATP-binding protein n=1 Tax=Peptostreptococcus faecalis TaxID=2045015 RepID=UPI000C7AD3C7|nr:ATP-binding cassette domain-containing protein [Peptostreptococcus faecalis]